MLNLLCLFKQCRERNWYAPCNAMDATTLHLYRGTIYVSIVVQKVSQVIQYSYGCYVCECFYHSICSISDLTLSSTEQNESAFLPPLHSTLMSVPVRDEVKIAKKKQPECQQNLDLSIELLESEIQSC